MSRVSAIVSKEFKDYFNSLMAYFFTVVFLGVVNALYVWMVLFPTQQANLREYFEFWIWGLWLFVPAITMRSWAEEKKLGTDELLLTLPVKDYEVVLGKYLATVLFLGFVLILSLTIPLGVAFLGSPDYGMIFSGYVGLFLLGASFCAIGVAVSSFTRNQFIAFLVSIAICLGFLGLEEVLNFLPLPDVFNFLVQYLDIGRHFDSIGRGVIDSRDIIYYLSIIAIFLMLNLWSIESRKR